MGRPRDLRQCNSLNNNLIRTQGSRGNLTKRCCGAALPGPFGPNGPAFHFDIRASRASQESLQESLTRKSARKSDMQRRTIVAMAAMLAAAPAFAEGTGSNASDAGMTLAQAKPAPSAPAGAPPSAHPAPPNPAAAASTPQQHPPAPLPLP